MVMTVKMVEKERIGENDEQARMCGRPTRRCKSDDDDVYGVLHGARGIDRAKSEMFSSLGSLRGSESATQSEKDGTVDTEHESRKSGRTRRVRETDVREE